MDQAILRQLTQRYLELPEEIKNFLLGDSFLNEVERIASLVGLSSDESLKLENEIVLILLAFSPVENFEDTMVNELGFNPGKAVHIARLTEEKLFVPIRNILSELAITNRATENSPVITTPSTIEQPDDSIPPIFETSLQKALHDLPNYSNVLITSQNPHPDPVPKIPTVPPLQNTTQDEPSRRMTYNAMLDVPTPGGESPKGIPEQWGRKF